MNEIRLTTDRLILRKFNENDMKALYELLSDKLTNKFLPWFPLKNIEETEEFYEKRIKNHKYYFAICLKENDYPIGYVKADTDESHDFGYALRKEFWHKGIVTEASRALISLLKKDGFKYITGTCDKMNPRSGAVMRQIGMKYRYSYKEDWQPKGILVIFRMYQLNFDKENTRVYKKYWKEYPVHFVEAESLGDISEIIQMRSEKEMMDLIINVARNDERILAAYMNGSRTNKNAKKDIFQDYDIVYVVKKTKPFYENEKWIDVFGERLYMQCPEKNDRLSGLDVDFDKNYGWLIQFKDWNRLDLHVKPLSEVDLSEDKLCKILLDKNGFLPEIPEATDEDYWIKKPSQDEFWACCNEFWWCLNNVAKGLWREEIPYIHQAIYEGIHPQLVKMLNWKVGYENNFKVSTGKASKYLKDFLTEDIWQEFLKTYVDGNIDDIWEAVFIMCKLFNDLAKKMKDKFNYTYDLEEAENSYGFLRRVYSLPQNTKSMY